MNDRLSVTFRFPDERTRHEFLIGLTDGFGENYCMIEWTKGVHLDDTTEVMISEVYDPTEGELIDDDDGQQAES